MSVMSIGPLSQSDLPAIWVDGEWRVLSCIPSDDNHDFPNWSDKLDAFNFPLAEIDLSWFRNRIMNQGSTSSCVGHGAAAGMEIVWKQQGRKPLQFDPYFVYGLINGGRDQGAMISDSLKALQQFGVCLESDLPQGIMFKKDFPQQAFESAKRFKLSQAYKCNSFEEICQAINVGFTVSLGLYVGSNFGQLDSEGVSPLPMGGGGGHCVLGCGLKQSQRYGWVIKIQNSWGTNWGNGGFSYLRKEHFTRMHPDAFAIQASFDDPNNPDNPPVVVQAAPKECHEIVSKDQAVS
jgi:hypothetical protein